MSKVVEPEQLDDSLTYIDPTIDSEPAQLDEGTSNEALDNLEADMSQNNIPEKFQGKSTQEIIESYKELEKAYGQRNNEVGELRKLTDDILKQQLEPAKQEKENQSIDFDELLEKPEEVIRRATKSELDELRNEIKTLKAEDNKKAFEKKHPDWQEKMSSPEFQNWLLDSPTRYQMFIDANNNYDYSLGSDLLDQYNILRGSAKQEAETKREAKRSENLKATSVEKGSTGETPKQYYRRADLMKLKMTDNDRYVALQDEIMLAYAEGRVK